jgi:hypothetical protein
MVFLILMWNVSSTFPETMLMTVHNRYPGIELASPVYFCNHGTYYEYFVGTTYNDMKAEFRSDSNQDHPGGILMYEVQRKRNIISDRRFSIDAIYTKVIEESKTMQLLVIWKNKRPGEPKIYIMLVEHDNELFLNRDKLAQLYNKINDIPFGYGFMYPHTRHYNTPGHTILMYDDTVLKAEYRLMQNVVLELDIAISEGNRDKYAMKSMWIDSER